MTKLVLAVLIAMSFSATALADGYICQAKNGSLIVKAYNYTGPAEQAKIAAVMLLVDPQARSGAKTIARFSDAAGTLTGDDTTFTAQVDLRFKDQHNKETLVAGKAQLQELDTIVLKVDADSSAGTVELNKRDGDQIELDVGCDRYENN